MARTSIITTAKGPKIITANPKPPRERHRRAISTPSNGKMGQPPVYDPIRFPHIAHVLCKTKGFTNEELAMTFGVVKKTVESWMMKYEEFREAVRSGKFYFDTEHVEQALLKRALGYSFTERTTKSIYLREKDPVSGQKIKIPAKEVTVVEKVLPPDVKAITFWLTNRRSEDWKMTVNVKGEQVITNTQVTVSAELEDMNTEQLMALRDIVASNSQGQGQKVIEINPMDDEIFQRAEQLHQISYTDTEE